MEFDVKEQSRELVYKLLASCVVPRPIAWVTTVSASGQINTAPYSFFNVMGSAPPVVALGIQTDNLRGEHGLKDTARNCIETRELVINLVPEQLAEAMNVTAVNAPAGVNEVGLTELTYTPSQRVQPPRIQQSPVTLECRLMTSLQTGLHQIMLVAEVVWIEIADECLLPRQDGSTTGAQAFNGRVDLERMNLVGRTTGSSYVRLTDRFDLVRPDWSTFSDQQRS